LTKAVANMGLTPIFTNLNAKKVIPENIAFLGEYFEKTRLSWFNDGKHFTVVSFIETESIDERATELLEKLKVPEVDDPENDKVADLSELLANYPCYNAVTVSFRNDDPKRAGNPSYIIVIRANKVVIKSSDYQYNAKDMS
jgi:hypothetical protein